MSALWGIGSYVDDDARRAPWRISHDEIGRDIGAATHVLSQLDLGGQRVLWCSLLSQAGQFWPYVLGTVMAGARLSCADSTVGEAVRVAMFLHLMQYDAVFGVTPEILDGLDEMERGYAEVFAGVRILAAHPGAYERLARAGCTPTRFAVCGPAIALGREPDGPAFVASDEWEIGSDADRIWISARQPRAQEFARTPTGVRGTIVDGGVVWANGR